MENYVDCQPKTNSDKIEFVKNNAPKIVDGIAMIERYLKDLKKQTNSRISHTRTADGETVSVP